MTGTTSSVNAVPVEGVSIARAAQQWAEELVDLTGRNRLLYYRSLTVGTLDLSEIQPDALVKLLRGSRVQGAELLAGNYEDTHRRLRRIQAQSQAMFEERGLRTSFLALGLATWTDTTSSATPNAPVLLGPLRISPQGGARSDFDLQVDSDWVINPTMLFKLRKEYGVSFELPDELDPDGDGFDPGDVAWVFDLLQKQLEAVPDFTINDTALIGNFTYNRQPMVEDLEQSAAALEQHPVVRSLAGDDQASIVLQERQRPVSASDVDALHPSEEFLILDADSSQMQVIQAVLSGSDMVIQGPPGTGKSQTISNLIAALVANRKSVLFVAQKRAAIDAVIKRLHDVGLGDMVLDLHDGIGTRRATAAQLGFALDQVGSTAAINRQAADNSLVGHRDKLRAHVEMMNAAREPWGVTLYQLQSELLESAITQDHGVRIAIDAIEQLSVERIDEYAQLLSEWVALGGATINDPESNAWAGAYGKITEPATGQSLVASVETLDEHTLPETAVALQHVLTEVGLREPVDIAGWATVFDLLKRVDQVNAWWRYTIWSHDLTALHTTLTEGGAGLKGVFSTVFNASYRAAKKTVRELTVDETTDLRALIERLEFTISLQSDWAEHTVDGGPPRQGQWTAEASKRLATLTEHLTALGAWLSAESVQTQSIEQASTQVKSLQSAREFVTRMPHLFHMETQLKNSGLGSIVHYVRTHKLDPEQAFNVAVDVWVRSVIDHIAFHDPATVMFDGDHHHRRVEAFRRGDAEHIEAGAARVKRAWATWVNDVRNAHPVQEAVIAGEARKKSRHKSFRELFTQAPDMLRALTPCWVMSPLVVSQLLPATTGIFDVVIFDEASQVLPAEAIPAILRGSQIVVAGDSKQLPPTTFFSGSSSSDDEHEEEVTATSNMESILDSLASRIPSPHGQQMLRWHYRSRDESLIAFSNVQRSLYGGRMVTFPGVRSNSVRHVLVDPVQFNEHQRGDAEVDAVVQEVLQHVRQAPEKSLGVIALGITHADRVVDAIERKRYEDPVLDLFLQRRGSEAFFVKNLERVQGDERDCIILTLGYQKGPDGQMYHRFGPINQQGGERRLNVAITRAREQMTVVSSFSSTDLDDSKLRAEGAQMLKRYLEYAESGGRLSAQDVHIDDQQANDPLLGVIAEQLSARGVPVRERYGSSGARIDLALGHPDHPEICLVAVEVDGASYGIFGTVRDRDRLRQDHLERLDWKHLRIWSKEWLANPNAQVNRILSAWNESVRAFDEQLRLEQGGALSDEEVLHRLQNLLDLDAVVFERVTAQRSGEPASRQAQSGDVPKRVGQAPNLGQRGAINKYKQSELVRLIRWVESDTLLRSNDQIIDECIEILGFSRRGPRIVEALSKAIEEIRTQDGRAATTTHTAPLFGHVITSQGRIVVVDVETSGLSPDVNQIIEIGILTLDQHGQVIDRFESLVNPQGSVGRTDIHGITNQMVRSAPTFKEIAAHVAKRLDGAVFAAHNSAFDRGFVDAELHRAGIDVIWGVDLDTLQLIGGTLSNACRSYDVPLSGAHRAINDAEAVAGLLRAIPERLPVGPGAITVQTKVAPAEMKVPTRGGTVVIR